MRRNALRVLGLVLIVWTVAAATPARRASAQSCACTLLCIRGDFCCPTELNGHCHQQCEIDGDPCPSVCICNLLCVVGDHCCAGITPDGMCTRTCLPNSMPCPQ